jgi:multimeric flavodoxin WrbA
VKKNVLVLTGSPRTGGNSDLLATAFIKGATQAGHDVVECQVGQKNIMGCKACDTCYSTGKPCTFDAEFNSIAPLLEKAEAIVFITPLYWFTFPTQIKAVIDKMYAFIIGGKKLKINESMLLVCGEATEEAYFDSIVNTYRMIAGFQKWTDRGQLIVPGVLNKGDVLSTNYLDLAEKMGHNI